MSIYGKKLSDLKRCSFKGWRWCDRIAVTECLVCAAPICKKCFLVHRVWTGGGFQACCNQPVCKRALVIRAHYHEWVEAGLV